MNNSARKQTWDMVTRWIHGIGDVWNNESREILWNSVAKVDVKDRKETLPTIAIMNLKKIPGKAVTVVKDLEQQANNDRLFLRRQFDLYYPHVDLYIACGSIITNLSIEIFDPVPSKNSLATTSRGIRYFILKNRSIFIDYSHPEARIHDPLLFYGIVDAVREIRILMKK